jgi:predicted nucleic acid-binding protein
LLVLQMASRAGLPPQTQCGAGLFQLAAFAPHGPPANILSWDLGPGETQVVSHAVLHGADRVVIDDLEARRCAKAMGLANIGTLGIVGRAKAAGLIDRTGPVVQRLRETGLYASDDIVQRLLREVGESPVQDRAC